MDITQNKKNCEIETDQRYYRKRQLYNKVVEKLKNVKNVNIENVKNNNSLPSIFDIR
jgi:hypothetical protein